MNGLTMSRSSVDDNKGVIEILEIGLKSAGCAGRFTLGTIGLLA